MRLRSDSHTYSSLDGSAARRNSIPWYWRLIAFAASWMVLGGFLVLPAAYDVDPQLRFNTSVLVVLTVVLLCTGYSLVAVLCLVGRSKEFQAENVFFPTFTSSALGLLTVVYNFAHSNRYTFNTAAIISVALSVFSSILFGGLYWWTRRKAEAPPPHAPPSEASQGKRYSEPYSTYSDPYYKNYVLNMYPTMRNNSDPSGLPLTEDDRVKQNWAMLYKNKQPNPSPDASQSTFRIDLPSGAADEPDSGGPRSAGHSIIPRSLTRSMRPAWSRFGHARSTSLQDQALPTRSTFISPRSRQESFRPGDDAAAPPAPPPVPPAATPERRPQRSQEHERPPQQTNDQEQLQQQRGRGRSQNRDSGAPGGGGVRAVSREERRREIELGQL